MVTRILLADEHTIFRDAVRSLMEKRGDLTVVGEAEDGPTASALIEKLAPDLVVTEIALPRLSGIEVTRRVVRAGSRCRFLILSSDDGGSGLQQAISAGASGFVCKSDPSEQLLQAVDVVSSGRSYVSPSVAHYLVEIVASGNESQAGPHCLSSREREVLQLVAEGLSSKEIATSLGISTRTVESHRANLMEKLDIHKISGLVRYAIREGLVSA